MASLTTQCPKCEKKLKLPSLDAVGKKTRCPGCKQPIVVPPPAASPPASRSPVKNPASANKPARRPKAAAADVTLHAAEAPFGLNARWIADDASAIAPPPSVPPVAATPAPADASLPDFGAAKGVEATESDAVGDDAVIDDAVVKEPVANRSSRSGRSSRRSRKVPSSLVAGGIVLLAAGGLTPFLLSSGDPAPQTPVPITTDPTAAVADAVPLPDPVAAITSPTRGEPIDAMLMPEGVSVVLHIRPADLWGPANASLRATLPPELLTRSQRWLEQTTRHRVDQLAEVTLAIVLGGRGTEPQVTTIARLNAAIELGPFLQQLGGMAEVLGGDRRAVTIGQETIIIRDLQTLAIGPAATAAEVRDAIDRPSEFVANGLTDVLLRTDRSRLLSAAAVRNDLEIHNGALLGSDGGNLLQSLLDVFGRDCEGVAVSLHQGTETFVELLGEPSRNVRLDDVRQSTADRWQATPGRLMAALRTTQPTGSVREFVGRVPAMLQAATLASRIDTVGGLLRMQVSLPPQAGPNLAAATFVTYNVLQSPRVEVAAPAVVATVAPLSQRLAQPVEASFSRVPLQEALAYLAEEAGAELEIDGDALKDAGYTKNMAQQFDLGTVPIGRAIGHIAGQYEKMVVVFDEPANTVRVLTKSYAERRGLTAETFETFNSP